MIDDLLIVTCNKLAWQLGQLKCQQAYLEFLLAKNNIFFEYFLKKYIEYNNC